MTTRARRVVLLEERAQVGAGRADVARREQPAADGQQVRRERDGEAEQLRDLRHVLVRADLVRARRSRAPNPAWLDAFSDRPAPVIPDMASTTTLPGSTASLSGASASSAAVA